MEGECVSRGCLSWDRFIAAFAPDNVQKYPLRGSRISSVISPEVRVTGTRGRPGTPAEVVLRMLLLKHVRDFSSQELTREVRANLVYREFTRISGLLKTFSRPRELATNGLESARGIRRDGLERTRSRGWPAKPLCSPRG